MQDNINTEYEFIKRLGSGAQGTVWEVIRVSDGKRIAVKILPYYNDSSAEAAKEELDSLRAMATPVCHENIICYYGYVISDDRIYVEMEYIEGQTLDQYAKKLRDNNEYSKLYKHLILITKDIINGLLSVHKKNILHNDIKPTNIMIDKNLTPKLVDFGISCHTNHVCKLNSSSEKCCKGFSGTPSYASPEMYNNEVRYPQSDVWSLGMTLYEMATGKFPYSFSSSNPNLRDVFQAVQDETPKKLNTTNELLNTIVNRSLVRNPAERITVQEIHDLLKNYQ